MIPRRLCRRRGLRFTSPLERSELLFSTVLGEVKYKISVFGFKAKMKPAKYPYGSARPCRSDGPRG
jgi:hypothetical protein